MEEYIDYVLENGLYKEASFYKRVFTIVNDNKYFKKVDNVWHSTHTSKPLKWIKDGEQAISLAQPIRYKDMDTTVGRVMVNKLLADATNNKLPYYNEEFVASKVFDEEITPNIKTIYSLEEYKKVVRVIGFIRMAAGDLIQADTMKTLTEPVGIRAYKKTIEKQFDKEDPNWRNNDTMVAKYESTIMKWVKEYFKDDPTMGIVTSGKFLNQSIKKRFVTIGKGSTPDPIGRSKTITGTLTDGMQLDRYDIAAFNNTTRFGSAARGLETRDGGLTFKNAIRATHNYKIVDTFCKTKEDYPIFVTKGLVNGLVGSYKLGITEPLTREQVKSYVGKVLRIRYPTKCIEKGDRLCKGCTGESLGMVSGGIVLMAIKLGSLGMLASLAKFHASELKIVKVSSKTLL